MFDVTLFGTTEKEIKQVVCGTLETVAKECEGLVKPWRTVADCRE